MEPMTFTHTIWAEQVATGADLPDERLQNRLTAILVSTLEHPFASIPQANGRRGQAKATYRFYANPRVTTAARTPCVRHRDRPAVPRRGCRAGRARHDHAELHRLAQHPGTGPDRFRRAGAGRAPAHRAGRDHLGTGHRDLGPAVLGAAPAGKPGPEEKESGKWINGIDAARAVVYEVAGGQGRAAADPRDGS